MKIVFVNKPDLNIVSGGNLYNAKVVSALRDKGFEVEYMACELLEELEQVATNTYIIDSLLIEPTTDLMRLDREKTIFLMHMAPSLNPKWKEQLDQIISKESEVISHFKVISAGSACSDYLQKTSKAKNLTIVAPGVDEDWKKKRKYSHVPEKIINIGKITADKGQDVLIEALGKYKMYSWTLTFYGDMSDTIYMNRLMSLINDKGLDNRVSFEGIVAPSAINEIMISADLLIHTSLHENNAMCLIEAEATGLPFICSPTGDYERYMESDNAEVMDDFEVESLVVILDRVFCEEGFYGKMCLGKHEEMRTWNDVAEVIKDNLSNG